MKQSQYVVHNRGLSQILFSTPWSVRSIFKHVLVAAYIALITIIAFNFNSFKDALESSTTTIKITAIVAIAKDHAPQVTWDILLIFLELRLLRRTMKMLQTSNRNMWVFVPMSLIALGLGIFVAIFLPGWMHDKLLLRDNFIEKFKELSVFAYIYMLVPGLTILWSLINTINERRISPFVARANIMTSINMVFWISALACAAELADMLFLRKEPIPFNYHSPLQLFLMIATFFLLVITFLFSFWSQRDMRKKTNYKFFNKNIEQAIAVAMIIPLAIWLTSTFMSLKGNWKEYLFIGILALVLIGFVSFAFIRKTEMGSPRVFMVITSLSLTSIWILKFFFEYFFDKDISISSTLPIALIATAVVMSVIYWKSPMTSKLIQNIMARFVKALWLIVVASWIASLIPEAALQFIPEVEDTLNMTLVALPIILLAVTMMYWYNTQWKIKSHINYKEKKKKEKELKEAKNA